METAMTDARFSCYFEKKIAGTIKEFKLFTHKDSIAVAASGGKDSTTCLYVLQKLGYDIEAVTIDVAIGNYTKANLANIKRVCKELGIKLHVITFRKEFGHSLCYLRSMLEAKGKKYSSCMLCGILKRYLLNKYCRTHDFDCLATGHNLDDEAEAFVMNVFRNDFTRAMRQGPTAGTNRSKRFVARVKPLYMIKEDEVKRYSMLHGFPVNYEHCPCSAEAYRRQFIHILDEFEKKHPSVKYNIIRFHQAMANALKGTQKDEEVPLCTVCGEPSSKSVCKRCQIFMELGPHPKTARKER